MNFLLKVETPRESISSTKFEDKESLLDLSTVKGVITLDYLVVLNFGAILCCKGETPILETLKFF